MDKIAWRKSLKYKNSMDGYIKYHSTSIRVFEIIDYENYKELISYTPVLIECRHAHTVKELTKLAEKYWRDFINTMLGKGKNGYFKKDDRTECEKEVTD